MGDQLRTTRHSDTRDPGGQATLWLPLFVEWQPRRMQMLVSMREGLVAAGAQVRVDTIGDPERPLSMLRVRCPGTSVESAEHWLLRLVAPYDDAGEDWASDIDCVLHQRWREYPMFAGGPEVVDEIKERLEGMPQGPSTRFCGARWGVGYSKPPCLFTFARSAAEVARCMPDVQVAGGIESGGDPRQWLAIDVAHTMGDVAALREFGAGLCALGFGVGRYEWRDGRSALLTIYAGDGTVEDLEGSLAAAMPAPGLPGRFAIGRGRGRRGSWSTDIVSPLGGGCANGSTRRSAFLSSAW